MSGNDNATACWYPNGKTSGASNTQHIVPCNPSSGHSACCYLGDSCALNGLCYSTDGFIYRGGCTDSTWKDPACSRICSMNGEGWQDDTSFLRSCSRDYDTDGTFLAAYWVCGANTPCNTSEPFKLTVGAIQHTNITGTTEASQTSSANSTKSTNNCSTLPDQPETGANPTTVGVAVGVSLGVCLLAAIGWALWERRKRTSMAAASGYAPPPPPSSDFKDQITGDYAPYSSSSQPHKSPLQELDGQSTIHELRS